MGTVVNGVEIRERKNSAEMRDRRPKTKNRQMLASACVSVPFMNVRKQEGLSDQNEITED
jgi:hypothetical protein